MVMDQDRHQGRRREDICVVIESELVIRLNFAASTTQSLFLGAAGVSVGALGHGFLES